MNLSATEVNLTDSKASELDEAQQVPDVVGRVVKVELLEHGEDDNGVRRVLRWTTENTKDVDET